MDNLRRTLSAPAAFLALLVGWTLPLPAAALWSGFVVATLRDSHPFAAFTGMCREGSGSPSAGTGTRSARISPLRCRRSRLLVTLLAHQAWLMTDAIVRTFFRLFVRHQAVARVGNRRSSEVQRPSSICADTIGGWLAALRSVGRPLSWLHISGDRAWPVAAPFVILWMLSPAVARWASLPPAMAGCQSAIGHGRTGTAAHRTPDLALLRDLRRRRKITCFRRTTSRKNRSRCWPIGLPPPISDCTCCRWSPPAISAGWVSIETVERLEATLGTMNGLERFRGHFYNWYDTRDLRPLEPKYVSSVDSGNLAGHLIALGNACREIVSAPVTRAGMASPGSMTRWKSPASLFAGFRMTGGP